MKTVTKLKLSHEHVVAALEGYLKAMTMIDDDDTVLELSGSGTHFTLLIEKD